MEKKSLFQRIRQSLKLDDEMDEAQIRKAAGLIRNIFRYMDKDAKDIMTHRKNIVAIDATETLENAFQFMLGESYSRFPIYEEDIDQIIGFIHLREAATCYLDESLRKRPVKELDTYIRSVSFIPETKSIDKLFKEMQTKKNSGFARGRSGKTAVFSCFCFGLGFGIRSLAAVFSIWI